MISRFYEARVSPKNRTTLHNLDRHVKSVAVVLAQESRIEVENFLVLEVKRIDRGENAGYLLVDDKLRHAPHFIHQLVAKPSKRLLTAMKSTRDYEGILVTHLPIYFLAGLSLRVKSG